jgi:hypothetical protein
MDTDFSASSEIQAPSSNIQKNSKLQSSNDCAHHALWSLGLEVSLKLGGWNLALLHPIHLIKNVEEPNSLAGFCFTLRNFPPPKTFWSFPPCHFCRR